MRVLIQRVKRASVTIDGETVSKIGSGLLVLVGICEEDGEEDIIFVLFTFILKLGHSRKFTGIANGV